MGITGPLSNNRLSLVFSCTLIGEQVRVSRTGLLVTYWPTKWSDNLIQQIKQQWHEGDACKLSVIPD